MNVLFITLLDISTIDNHSIYSDLICELAKNEHEVYVVSPTERRNGMKTHLINDSRDDLHSRVHILKQRTGNIQKTNIIEKGISTLKIESQYIWGIKKFFSDVKFGLVIYSTPPITFCNVIEFVKRRDGAKTYLLLKDIFPQNAVDLGMMSKTGAKSVFYKFFRKKEKKLYAISDRIGCMSQANVEYVIKHNSEVDPAIVEVCPNSIEPVDISISNETKKLIREKYGIPLNKKVFIYGGNLGKPQGIDFLIKCLEAQKKNEDVFFLIVGDGTEYRKLDSYAMRSAQDNLKIMKRIQKSDYDIILGACDVGLIFLDNRFTIPNFPSRLLSYLQAKIPVLAATDPNTDIGKVIVEGGFGWWCESNDEKTFELLVSKAIETELSDLGKIGFQFLKDNYSVDRCYKIILDSVGDLIDENCSE